MEISWSILDRERTGSSEYGLSENALKNAKRFYRPGKEREGVFLCGTGNVKAPATRPWSGYANLSVKGETMYVYYIYSLSHKDILTLTKIIDPGTPATRPWSGYANLSVKDETVDITKTS
jgi:hypothetical protein